MARQYRQEWLEPEKETAEAGWRDPERRLQHQVEIQSQRIEQVLSRHHVPAGVSGGSVRPHWVSFDLVTHLSGGWDRLRKLTGELTSALGVPEVRLDRREGRLRLAVKRYEPHPVDLLDLMDLLPEAKDLSLALGLDHQGSPVMLNLEQTDLHNVLVTGILGAGKSSLMRSIAVALSLTCRQSQAQLAVISVGSAPSGIASRPDPLAPVNYLPHMLFPMASTPDEAVEALAYLVDEAAYRADTGISTPRLVVLVDDADMLLRRAGDIAGECLATLLHAPAESGLRVIVGAANPELPDLRALLQHNTDLRIVGRMADERAALAAAGREGTYAQYLEGKGDFLAVSAAGVVPFQAAYIDDYDLHLTLTELHRASDPVLLARHVASGPTLRPAWSSPEPQSFTYDGVNQQASFEPSDRSDRVTIDGDSAFEQGGSELDDDLSWLDSAKRPGISPVDIRRPLGRGEQLEPPDGGEGPAAGARPAENLPPDEPDDLPALPAAGPRHLGQARSAEETASRKRDDAQEAADEVRAADDPAGIGEAGTEAIEAIERGRRAGSYRMLPFNELPEPLEAASDPSTDAEPDHPGGGGTPGAQVLWPVEPTYTDFDDDMWDAGDPEEEDDWRKRLH